MCGVKLMDKKSTNDLMQMLDVNETIDWRKQIVSNGMDMHCERIRTTFSEGH